MDILVVGTTEGGPIPVSGKGFLRDHGKIVMARADPAGLARLAAKTGGHAHGMTLSDADLRALGVTGKQSGGWQSAKSHLKASLWKDDGYWLLWLILPVGLLCWRRGVLLLLPLVILPLTPAPAHASTWTRLWETPDQQGYQQFSHDPQAAARAFRDPAWKGAALYRAGKYKAAAEAFADASGADADYNRGNALARAGQLQKAIEAYNAALKANPDLKDAEYNKALVEKLLKQQKNRQKGKNGQNGKHNQDQGKPDNQGGKHGQSGGSSNRNARHRDDGNQDQKHGSDKQNQKGNTSRNDQSGANQSQQHQKPSRQNNSKPGSTPPQTGSNDAQNRKNGAQDKKGLASKAPSDDNLSQSDRQWLRRVPDDPSGLLRRKFLYQYQQQQNDNSQTGGDAPW
jgi:Ca-activated chloride channel family protein